MAEQPPVAGVTVDSIRDEVRQIAARVRGLHLRIWAAIADENRDGVVAAINGIVDATSGCVHFSDWPLDLSLPQTVCVAAMQVTELHRAALVLAKGFKSEDAERTDDSVSFAAQMASAQISQLHVAAMAM